MRDLLISSWAQVRAGLLATADKFSNDELPFRAAPNAYSVADTLLHIANEEDGEIRYGITRDLPDFPAAFDPSLYAGKPSILAVLDGVHERTLAYLQTLSDSDLDDTIETPWGMRARRSELFLHVMEHEIHHRGELSLILGLLGREGLDA